jgi:hypothetical protein
MHPIYLLTNVPYNKKDIPLGGLLSDIRYPNQDVLNVANVAEGSQHVAVRTENNIQHDLQTSERSWFDAQISRLVATSYQRSLNDNVRISSREGRIYELKQPRALFKSLCENSEVKEWLEEDIKSGSKSYMIVGYRTFSDASTVAHQGSSKEIAGKAQAPLADLVSTIPGVGQAVGLDLGVGGGQGATVEGNVQATFPGERVYAICYRRVKFDFKPWNSAGPRLESENHWVMFSETRRPTDEQDAEMVDADLDDDDLGEELLHSAAMASGTEAFGMLA